jgi:hypothetical protein
MEFYYQISELKQVIEELVVERKMMEEKYEKKE